MKRWIIYALVIALMFLISPAAKTDVGELLPVELLYICYGEDGRLRVETDTGDAGAGTTLEEALSDLKETACGNIFLDTVDYLMIHPNALTQLPRLWEILRPATQVCRGTGIQEETVKFLSAHKPGITLNDVRGGTGSLPTLKRIEERYRLEYE